MPETQHWEILVENETPRWDAAGALGLCRAVNQVILGEKNCATAMQDLYHFQLFLDWFGRDFKRYTKIEAQPEIRLKSAFRVATSEAFGTNPSTETACKFLVSELSRLSNNGKPHQKFITFVKEMIEMLEGSVEQKVHA